MEPIFTELLKFGFGGAMAAVVVAFAWLLLKRQLDGSERDRREFTEALKQQQGVFVTTVESICRRLESIETRMASCHQHSPSSLSARRTKKEGD